MTDTVQPAPPFMKLCQIIAQGAPDAEGRPTVIYYQEDRDGKVLVNTFPSFPITLQCEVINWENKDQYDVHGAIVSFEAVEVTVTAAMVGKSLRQEAYEQLLVNYPSLVI